MLSSLMVKPFFEHTIIKTWHFVDSLFGSLSYFIQDIYLILRPSLISCRVKCMLLIDRVNLTYCTVHVKANLLIIIFDILNYSLFKLLCHFYYSVLYLINMNT